MKPTPTPLTLGDIAKYCHVDRVTVQRWTKTGLIPAYRTPGGHYRVTKEDFRRFLQKNHMPIYAEFFQDVPRRILIADSPQDAEALAQSLQKASTAYEIKVCKSGPEALLSLGHFQPDLAVLNVELEGLGGTSVCEEIKKTFPDGHLYILAIIESDRWKPEELLAAGAVQCLKKPLDAQEFVEVVRGIMEPTLRNL